MMMIMMMIMMNIIVMIMMMMIIVTFYCNFDKSKNKRLLSLLFNHLQTRSLLRTQPKDMAELGKD